MATQTSAEAFEGMLEARGVTRRTFLGFCGVIAASIGLSEAAAPDVAQAIESSATSGSMLPVIWLEQGSCTGCTESFAQSDTPDVGTIVLDLLSVNYSETLSAGAGWSLEAAKEATIEKGGYILVVEGAIMTAWDGNALLIGQEETFDEYQSKKTVTRRKGTDIVADAAKNAAAVLSVGSCAVDGGWQAADPNPGGAIGVQQLLTERGISTPVVNLPTCPVNPEWIVSVVIDYVMLGKLPECDKKGFPKLIFGETVHDNCQRRGHFENGEFVYKFGSKEETLEYCLYPLGCKGPQTYTNCPVTRWNAGVSWCVASGAPCAGCGQANPFRANENWVTMNTPFLKRHRVIGAGIQPTTIGCWVGGLLAVALTIHGFGMKMAGRVPKGANVEPARRWDVKHPDKALFPETLKNIDASKEEAGKKGGDK